MNVNRINVAPDFLKRIVPTGNGISIMKHLIFYFPGGGDVVVLEEILDGTLFNVFVPVFSKVVYNDAQTIVRDLIPEIKEQMKLNGIKNREPFLFDTVRKIILVEKSFSDWIPFYDIKTALFKEKGSNEIMFLGDTTDYGALQAASVLMAKWKLFRPHEGQWSQVGKILLNFMVSKNYGLKASFSSINGSWNNVIYEFNNDPYDGLTEFLNDLNVSKALDLSNVVVSKSTTVSDVKDFVPKESAPDKGDDKIDDDNPLFLLPGDILNDWGDDGNESYKLCLLSDLLGIGIKHYMQSGKYGVIQAEIDVSKDLFDEILIDCVSGAIYVKLSQNCKMSRESVSESLQVDNVTIVESSKSLYNLFN